MPEKVDFKTADGANICASHWRGEKGSPAVLLLHMMPAARSSWDDFAAKLYENGFGVLAIDLRGHGESEGGPDGWRNFSDEDHQKSIEDVRAAVAFQATEGHSKFFIAGASIGANLALEYLAESERVSAAVLLSAGLNYRGIQALPLVEKVRPEQGVFLVAAKDDVRSGGSAAEMAEEIFRESAGKKEMRILEYGGHGTDMFRMHPELADEIITWLNKF
ncbi:MAG: alpha/beta fold hydrolase [Candidatus Niyogibacteria bacterium]|nr:alpha/beta fold hydrolase [Candidatus Niyogibacteria bacterium]